MSIFDKLKLKPKLIELLLIKKDIEIEQLKIELLISKGICQSKAEARRIIQEDVFDYVINRTKSL
ncbi:hypothetical protein LCGC14_1358530 [marine sediment metagenome]|uniref:Uncharacterized protein n=1 Tax=marine sediment metagenome TaxID=412755 RepID=A0A0F9MP65_9ZZZZ